MFYNDVEEDDVNEKKNKEMYKEKGTERIFKKVPTIEETMFIRVTDRTKRTKNSIAPIAKESSIFTFF